MKRVVFADKHQDLLGKPKWVITLDCGHVRYMKRNDRKPAPKRLKCYECKADQSGQ